MRSLKYYCTICYRNRQIVSDTYPHLRKQFWGEINDDIAATILSALALDCPAFALIHDRLTLIS